MQILFVAQNGFSKMYVHSLNPRVLRVNRKSDGEWKTLVLYIKISRL